MPTYIEFLNQTKIDLMLQTAFVKFCKFAFFDASRTRLAELSYLKLNICRLLYFKSHIFYCQRWDFMF